MKNILSIKILCFAWLGALSLFSFIVLGCQPLLQQQVELTDTITPLPATATVTAEEISTNTPTMVAGASATITSTKRPTFTPTLTPVACFHLIYPGNGTTISGGSTIRFRWNAQPGAQLYILTVIHPDNSRSDAQTKNTNASLSLKKLSKTTIYKWYVNAVDLNGNLICNSATFFFTKTRNTSDSSPQTAVVPPEPEFTPTSPSSYP